MKIGTREMSQASRPYLVAEVGLNHDGSLDRARDLIWQAARAGASAVKFQAVKADTLVHPKSPTYFQQQGPAATTQREFFKRSDRFGPLDYRDLATVCTEAGVQFLCTPFDLFAVEWLEPLVPAWKIASADITFRPLLEAVAKTNKPIILSTGAATLGEIDTALDILAGVPIALLHCVLAYPTPVDQANLLMIPELQRRYPDCLIGYSDHTRATQDMETCFLAYCLGARIIEKHFTGVGEQGRPGNDHYHSMDACQLAYLKAAIEDAGKWFGAPEKRVLAVEEDARRYARRGLYAARSIAEGAAIGIEDIAILRPSARLGPEHYREILLSRAAKAYAEGDPL